MSKAIGAIRAIDEAITNTLTKFCWWTDIHYEKDNVWWAKITLAIFLPALEVIQFYLYEKEPNITASFLFFVMLFFLVWAMSYVAVECLPVTRQILANAQKSPNKNRTDLVFYVFKITVLAGSFLFWVFPVIQFFSSASVIDNDYALFISLELILYLLCTEPIPPAVKRRKLEEKELKRLQFTHQKN